MMDAERILSNPPVQEAILDIRFSTNTENVLDEVNKFAKEVSARYPSKKDKVEFNMQIGSGKGETPQVLDERRIVGCILQDEENRKIIQISTNTFSCHLLPPYAEWKELFDMMKHEWS